MDNLHRMDKKEISDAVEQIKKQTLEDKLPPLEVSHYVSTVSGYACPVRNYHGRARFPSKDS